MNKSVITNKHEFSKDSLIWLRIIIIIQLMFLMWQVAFAILQFKHKPTPIYFPLNAKDQLINNTELNEPGLTDAELLNWVTEAMMTSFSFNYHNYNNIAEKIEEYFDSTGIESYLKMISEHKQIQQVVNKKLILSGRPTAAPRIVQDAVIDGKYAWQVLLPFILRFNNQTTNINSEITLNIFIVRTKEQQATLGVKIVNIEDFRISEQKANQQKATNNSNP